MKNKFQLLIAPVVFCWCLFYLLACNSPLIGDKTLLNKGDQLNLVKDTLKLRILSIAQNKVSASGISTGVLGSLYDPYFGSTYAGFYAQFGLTSSDVYFGISPVLDSVVLTLQYEGNYGPFTKPVDIYVYQVNARQGLVDTQNYFTNTAFQVNLPPIGKKLGFVPDNNTLDSVPILGVNYPVHLRVPLAAAYGDSILFANTSVLSTTDSFFTVFRGLYITVNSGAKAGNGVEYFDLTSVISGVTVYYHSDTSYNLTFTLPVSGASLNHFDNIYTGSPAYAAMNKPPANGGSEQEMYVQAGGGVAGEIILSDLDSIPKNIAINKAELVLSVQPGDSLPLPNQLSVYRVDDAGVPQTLDDATGTFFGGLLTAETVNGVTINRYRFNMPLYFQKVLKGVYRNNGLVVASSYASTSTERVIIANSFTNKNYQVTLDILYTKL